MSEWISVRDRLPEDHKSDFKYLALYSDGFVDIVDAYVIKEDVNFQDYITFDTWIEYWMPLPELPEEYK